MPPLEARERIMVRSTPFALGLATLMLAGCGDGSGPPVVQVSAGGPATQALEAQIVNLQHQIGTLQQRLSALEARLPPPPR